MTEEQLTAFNEGHGWLAPSKCKGLKLKNNGGVIYMADGTYKPFLNWTKDTSYTTVSRTGTPVAVFVLEGDWHYACLYELDEFMLYKGQDMDLDYECSVVFALYTGASRWCGIEGAELLVVKSEEELNKLAEEKLLSAEDLLDELRSFNVSIDDVEELYRYESIGAFMSSIAIANPWKYASTVEEAESLS